MRRAEGSEWNLHGPISDTSQPTCTDAAEQQPAQLHAHANFMCLARIPSTECVNQHPMKEEEIWD